MGMPAARIGDMHVCPMVTVLVPHVGGPVLPPGGLTDENTPPADDNDRPQADPEVPALGEWERRRGQFPTDESTGVEPPDTDG